MFCSADTGDWQKGNNWQAAYPERSLDVSKFENTEKKYSDRKRKQYPQESCREFSSGECKSGADVSVRAEYGERR